LLSRGRHLGAPRSFSEKPNRLPHRLFCIGHLQRGTRLEREARGFGEVEHAWPENHRRAAGERLDQVLPAKRQKRSADDGDVAGGVIKSHLAHRVAQIDLCSLVWRRLAAAPGVRPLRDLVEALWMARYDDDQGRIAHAFGFSQKQFLFSFARARKQENRPAGPLAPCPTGSELSRIGFDVELQVAGH